MKEHNGKLYAQVSDIIKPSTNFDHIDKLVLANKAAIGTEVHEAIAHYIIGEDFPAPSFSCLGYMDSFYNWAKGSGCEFLCSEQRYFCDEKMLTGQIDSIIQFPEKDQIYLIDFKTSVKESPVTWPMQAHLYYYLLKKNNVDVGTQFIFLKLDKQGKFPGVFEYDLHQKIMDDCMKAIDEFWKF